MESRTIHLHDSLPTLYIPWPRCGHCDNEVEVEDGEAWCTTCLVQWGDISEDVLSTPNQNVEGAEVPCQIVSGSQSEPHEDKHGRRYVPGPRRPCILPSGHGGIHLCPYDVQVSDPAVTEV